MITTTTQLNPPQRRRARCGFTLTEILVAIGIIVLLVSLAIPVVLSSFRKARALKSAADLQAIATGLEAYHADFGDYPRGGAAGTGFAVLCKAMIAPGPGGGPLPALVGAGPYPPGTYSSTGTPGMPGYNEFVCFGAPSPTGEGFSAAMDQSDTDTWAPFAVSDGKDGPGFRARPGGKTYGPYLQADKFKLQGLAILDGWGNPILYFPARPGKIAQDTSGSKTWPLITLGTAGTVYNANDNISFFLRGVAPPENVNMGETVAADTSKALVRMDAFLVQGSTDFNGMIGANESPKTTGPYLLWSAGADGKFGVSYDTAAGNPTKQEIGKCDDVTNFGQ